MTVHLTLRVLSELLWTGKIIKTRTHLPTIIAPSGCIPLVDSVDIPTVSKCNLNLHVFWGCNTSVNTLFWHVDKLKTITQNICIQDRNKQ